MVNNNRPVSLLPVLSKVAKRIAMRQFNDYLTLHNRLRRHQSGNRTLHSTETLSLLVTDDIFKAMDSRQITAMVLIDLSKAFDSICHSTLLSKLQQLGTSEQALLWFKSYRQTAVYSSWNIIVGSPNHNSRGTSGVHVRPDAVYTLYE